MKVFVAGATGAVGKRLVPALRARGYEVVGLTRSAEKAGLLRGAGAQAVVADALDRDTILRVVSEVKPDVIIHHTSKGWLVLIEAVTSHGPINPKRRSELKHLFRNSKAGIVYVTAFLTRRAMVEYLNEISWETEVWVAEAPSHLIHFNGERFLGPY